MREKPLLYQGTEEQIKLVVRYLRAGKSPKEIGFLIHKSVSTVWVMVHRYQAVKQTYNGTYNLRYPNKIAEALALPHKAIA